MASKNITIGAKSFKFDFEVGAMNAARSVFPNYKICGCNFHFNAALIKRVKDLKPQTSFYDRRSKVRRHVQMLASLAHLPEENVEEGFLTVMKTSPNSTEDTLFNDYFCKQWFENRAVGLTWVCSGERHRTTNLIESWHHRMNGHFNSKPNWYHISEFSDWKSGEFSLKCSSRIANSRQ